MITAITTLILAAVFFFSGYIIQAIKRILVIAIKLGLRLISFFGVKIKTKEKSLIMSEDFRLTYKEIKTVKLSNKNLKEKSSIDWINLGLFIGVGLLIIANLQVVSGNAISNWLFSLIQGLKIVKSAIDMNTLYTATLFSALSFAATKVFQRWKETKPQRLDKKNAKLKEKAVQMMSTKELLDSARKKDEAAKKKIE